jgi:hypothetical protein
MGIQSTTFVLRLISFGRTRVHDTQYPLAKLIRHHHPEVAILSCNLVKELARTRDFKSVLTNERVMKALRDATRYTNTVRDSFQ